MCYNITFLSNNPNTGYEHTNLILILHDIASLSSVNMCNYQKLLHTELLLYLFLHYFSFATANMERPLPHCQITQGYQPGIFQTYQEMGVFLLKTFLYCKFRHAVWVSLWKCIDFYSALSISL